MYLVASLDAPGLAVLKEHLVHALVEHEGTTVDGTQTRETLRHAAQAVHRVDVRRLAVALEGVHIQLDGLCGGLGGLLEIVIIAVQCHGVAGEGLRVGVQAKVFVQLTGGDLVQGLALMVGRRLGLVVVGQEDQEVAELTLLEKAHQTGVQGLRGSGCER